MNQLHKMLLATSALVAATVFGSAAQAGGGPTGGKVAIGSATITTPSSNKTVVDQSSNAALINWNSFSIPTGSEVLFEQPNSKSVTVNRVTGPNASTIDGELLANGNIWILNANGILFGRGSEVNVGALLATTSDLSDDDFRKGHYRFTKPGSANASVINDGTITAANGGSVVLSASEVANQGIIQANLGTVVLGGASEFTVDLDGDNILRYQITAPVTSAPQTSKTSIASALVSNSGTIEAAGGHILLTARAASNVQDDVINNTGHIEATSVSSHNGEIDLDAGPDGTVDAGGTIAATGDSAGQTGGDINITGKTVNVENGATVDASGDAGGGTIQIGGGFHGKGTIANAQTTNVGNATISANANTSGNGGEIAIWSDGATNFEGTISATGGAQGGSGGFVETSGGNLTLGANAKVVTSAAKGQTGTWLLDPTDIDIISGGTDGLNGSNIDPNTIIAALGSTNVELEATDDITISSAVDYTSSNTLSLLAGQDIIAYSGIQNSGTGAINLIAGWNASTTNPSQLLNPGVYGNNNGTIYIGGEGANGAVAIGSAKGTTTFAAANMYIDSEVGNARAGYYGNGGGNIVIDVTDDLDVSANEYDAHIGNGAYDMTTGASGNITINVGGDFTLESYEGTAEIGNGSASSKAAGNVTGDITLNVAGTTYFDSYNDDDFGDVNVGNVANAASGYTETGNVTLMSGSYNDETDSGATLTNVIFNNIAGGNVTIGATASELDFYPTTTPANFTSQYDLTLVSTAGLTVDIPLVNLGSGNINLIAGWDGTTALSSAVASGAYGLNGGSVLIGADDSSCACSIGSFSGTTTVAGYDITINGGDGYGQIGFPGAGGGNINVDAVDDLNLNTYDNSNPVQIGNGAIVDGSPNFSGNVTGNISINVGNTTVFNAGEGTTGAWIGNIAGNGGVESGNVSLITGNVSDSSSDAISLGNMLVADLGTTSAAGSGGNVAFGLTNPQTDSLNEYIGYSSFSYDSPNALTLLTTQNFTLGYSIQNSGTGDLTILAGWNPSVAPSAVLTTAGAYGNNGANIWVVGYTGDLEDYNSQSQGYLYVDSGLGVSIGSAGGTTTIGAAQIYVEGLSGYAQIGYHGSGSGTINVIANGTPGDGGLTGVDACFDGDANICVIGGREATSNGNPSYAQIGDLGLGVAGTSTANINISATGNIAVAGGGIYDNSDEDAYDPEIPNAYGMIGNGDATQSVAATAGGNITVNVAGSLNFASSEGTGSEAWLGNQTGTGGLAYGNLTVIAGSEDDSGPIDFANMIVSDLGSTSVAGSGGNVVLGMTDEDIKIKGGSGLTYDSPNNLTLLGADDIDVGDSILNLGSGDITLIAGWNPNVAPANVLTTPGAYGVNNGEVIIGGDNATGNVAVGSMTGTTTVAGANVILDAENGFAQIGTPGSGSDGTINVYATSSQAPIYNQDTTPCLENAGNVCLASGQSNGFYAQIGNGGYNENGTSSGNINVVATGNVVLVGGGTTISENNTLVPGDALDSYAMIGNGDASQTNTPAVGGNVSITVGGETYLAEGSDPSSIAWLGNRTGAGGLESGDFTFITGSENDNGYDAVGDFIFSALNGSGGAGGGNVVVGFTAPDNTVTIDHDYDASSSNSLTVLSVGDIDLTGQIQNSGTGDITLVAGWDGQTLGTASQIESANAYGLNSGQVVIGGLSAAGTAAVGSDGGTTTVLTDSLTVESDTGIAQLGYSGAGGGAINVVATGDVTVNALNGTYAEIGNGSLSTTGNVGGDIDVSSGSNIYVEANSDGGIAAIGNISSGSQSGNIGVYTTSGGSLDVTASGGYNADNNYVGAEAFIGNGSPDAATTGGATGNITVGVGVLDITASGDLSQAFIGDGAVDQAEATSAGTTGGIIGITATSVSLEADEGDDLISEARIANRGTGTVEGSYSITTTGDIDIDATDGNLSAIGAGEFGSGTTSGDITLLAGGAIDITSEGSGETRVGDDAAPDANINVTATDDISISTSGPATENGPGIALIGNLGGTATGGNITIKSTNGGVTVDAGEADSVVEIGSVPNGSSDDVTGTIKVTADNATNGVVEVEATGEGAFAQIGGGGDTNMGSAIGNITVTGGAGVILDASASGAGAQIGNGGYGFVGTTGGTVTVTGSNSLYGVELETSADGTFVQIGNGGYDSQGASSGAVSVTAPVGSIYVSLTGDGTNGQIGNGGVGSTGGASGTVGVMSTNTDIDVTLDGTGDFQIGNGGLGSSGNDSGNIMVTAGGNLNLTTSSSDSNGTAIQIGNGGNSSNESSSTGFTETGNVTVNANEVNLETKNASSDIQIGNGGNCAGANGASNACGSLADATTDGSVVFSGTVTINAGSSLSMIADNTSNGIWIGNGGDNGATNLSIGGGSLTDTGNVSVTVGSNSTAGLLEMQVGTPGGSDARIGNGGYDFGQGATASGGLKIGGNVTVDVEGGESNSGSLEIEAEGSTLSGAIIGNEGQDLTNGTVSGTTGVTVDGNLSMSGNASGPSYALIGNEGTYSSSGADPTTIDAVSMDVSGYSVVQGTSADITLTGAGDGIGSNSNPLYVNVTDLALSTDGGSAYISSTLDGVSVGVGSNGIDLGTGNLTLKMAGPITQTQGITANAVDISTTSGAIDLNSAANAINSASLSTTGSGAATLYDASSLTVTGATVGGNLTLLTEGNLDFVTSVQLANGSILGVAGWDGTTTNPSSLISGSAYGNNGGSVVVGGTGASGAVSVGSANGTTTLAGDNVSVLATNGAAQIGYDGSNGGNITIVALDDVVLTDPIYPAEIGNGTTFGSSSAGGNVTITAAGLTNTGDVDIQGNSAEIDLTGEGTGIGTSGNPLQVAVNDLAVQSEGSVYISSPSQGVSLGVGSDGTNVGNSAFVLTADGVVTQTQAILAGSISVDATSGTITLQNTGNEFGQAYLQTSGSNGASLYDSVNLTMTGADVGGTLTLGGAGTIGQSGAISANALDVSSTGGAITLTNTGNAFNDASVSTSGSDNASLYDASDLTITTANVGGTLTLGGGGTIGQSGAISANTLDVTTTNGAITLTNTGNAFDKTSVSTSGSDNASLYDTSNLTITGATVGGALTVNGAGTIGQSGAISASALDVSSTGGAITLTNTGNAFKDVSVSTSGSDNASLYDSSNLTITSADVGGTLTLGGGGTIGQTGAISANALDVTTTDGAITLTNTGNAYKDASVSTSGSDNASLYDTSNLTVTSADVGGTLTLNGAGTIGQTGAISANALDVSSTGGAITLTNTGNTFNDASVSTSGSDNASLYDASDLTITSATVGGTLTLAGGGTIGQSGAISANALDVTTTNGAITLANTGNAFGSATVSTSGSDDASLYDASNLTVTSANVGGTLTLSGGGTIGQSGTISANTLDVTTTNGAVTLTNTGNAVSNASLSTSGSDNASLSDSSNLTVTSANVGGTLTLAGAGTVGQSGVISANTVDVSSTGGAITLGNTGNAFGTAAVMTSGSSDATLYDSDALTISSANVGGTLTLTSTGDIGQTNAITANALDVSSINGDIDLANTGNAFNTLTVSTPYSEDATFDDISDLTIASANVGGTLGITDDGTVGQSGQIIANALNVTTSGGDVDLDDNSNEFNDTSLNVSGSGSATLADSSNLVVVQTTVGGALTVTGANGVSQSGTISANALDVTTTSGAIDLNNTANTVGTVTLGTSGSDDATFDDASNFTVASANVGGTLTLAGGGTIGQTGTISANALTTSSMGGAITLDNSGNAITTATLSTSGSNGATLADASDLTIASANVGGTLTVNAGGSLQQSGTIDAADLVVSAPHGSITLTDAGNQIAAASLQTSGTATLYDTGNLTVGSTDASGDLTILDTGNLTFVASATSDNGSVLAVAGWDGETTSPTQVVTGSAYGQNGGSIVIGGAGASGGVSVGAANGTTTLAGDNVSLDATNGYAQIGVASGSNDISVVASGNVTLTGGADADEFAQIGNGGYQSSGNESGDISVDATGNVALDGGAGQEAYAQIGHGGAESNKNSEGYSDTGLITVDGNAVTLDAGQGTGSYAQIGQGGYLAGENLSGTGTLGSATDTITVNSATTVTLEGGSAEAYAQIGDGGDLVNSNAANGANGSITAAIYVTAPGSIAVTAGSGADSFAQIGNGGKGENTPAAGATVDFTIGGNVSISDLTLTGSDTGADGYAQVGNGDASGTGDGNVSGNITIGPGIDVTIVDGTAAGTDAMIGNDTGIGTITGSITGYTPPSGTTVPPPGAVAPTEDTPVTPTDTSFDVIQVTPESGTPGDSGGNPPPSNPQPTPLDQLADNGQGGSSEGKDSTDDLTNDLGQSLDPGSKKLAVVTEKTLIPGVLSELVVQNGNTPHGVPPADQDYSSWGNEALWRW